jgi:thymidylate synthase (FAD)
MIDQDTHNQLNTPSLKPQNLDPLQDGISSIELVRVSGSDLDIVNAARVSYGKLSTELSERDKQLIKFLLEHKHTSPFEWMRHRINSYNEISYRFVKAKVEFYIPASWRYQDTVNKQSSAGAFNDEKSLALYKESLETSYRVYEQLLENGIAREQARGVLPVCIYTEFIFTCNLHSLMNFLRLRLDKGAQKEIRAYAFGLLQLANPHFPIAISEWKKLHMPSLDNEGWSVDFISNLSNNKQ